MSRAVCSCTRLRAPARALYFILPKDNKITFEGQQQSLCVPCQLHYRGIKADDGLRIFSQQGVLSRSGNLQSS